VQQSATVPRVVNATHIPHVPHGSQVTAHAASAHAVTPARVVAPSRESPNLATMTESIRTAVEQDDLDVPAFIRKRGEIN
jgi:hypothetical protein